jgi:hypothetical protein
MNVVIQERLSIISPPRYWLLMHEYQAPALLYMKIHVANRYRLGEKAIDLVAGIIKKWERESEERGRTRLRLNSSGPCGSFCAEVFGSANFCRYRPRIRFDLEAQDGGLLPYNFGSRHLLEGIFKNYYLKLL